MPTDRIPFITLPPGERSDADPVPTLTDGDELEIVVRRPDGATTSTRVAPSTARALHKLADLLQRGRSVAIVEAEQELSPNQAAQLLGMSRRWIVQRMDAGDLPFGYVGAHRRCRLVDVLQLKQREDERAHALRALAEDTESLMRDGL